MPLSPARLPARLRGPDNAELRALIAARRERSSPHYVHCPMLILLLLYLLLSSGPHGDFPRHSLAGWRGRQPTLTSWRAPAPRTQLSIIEIETSSQSVTCIAHCNPYTSLASLFHVAGVCGERGAANVLRSAERKCTALSLRSGEWSRSWAGLGWADGGRVGLREPTGLRRCHAG